MGLKRCDAIVLKSQKLGELDKIVTFLSRDEGKLRGVAKGARKLKQRFGPAFEPMTHAQIVYFEKGTSDLVRVESAEIVRCYFPESGETAAVLACVAELMDGFAQEKEANDVLFRLGLAVAGAANEGNGRVALTYFEIWLLRIAGLLPSIGRCAGCNRDVSEDESLYATAEVGGLRCDRCCARPGMSLGPAERRFIAESFRTPPSEMATRDPAPVAIALACHRYLRTAIEHTLGRRVKSYSIVDLNLGEA